MENKVKTCKVKILVVKCKHLLNDMTKKLIVAYEVHLPNHEIRKIKSSKRFFMELILQTIFCFFLT